MFDQLTTLTDVLSRSEANWFHLLSHQNYADTQADANHLKKKKKKTGKNNLYATY